MRSGAEEMWVWEVRKKICVCVGCAVAKACDEGTE